MSTVPFEQLIEFSKELQTQGINTNKLTPDQIVQKYNELKNNEKEIQQLENENEKLEQQIKDLEKKINENKKLIKQKRSNILKNNTNSYIEVVENTNKNNKNITNKPNIKKCLNDTLSHTNFGYLKNIPYVIDNNNNNNVAKLVKDKGFYYYKILGPNNKIIKVYIRDHRSFTPPGKGGMKTQIKIYEQDKNKSLNPRFYNPEDCNDRRNISEWIQFSSKLYEEYMDIPSLFLPANSSLSPCLESLKSMNKAQIGFFKSVLEYLMYCNLVLELNNL